MAGGNNNVLGTAQSDTINSLGGDDLIAADRGDNVISAGGGDDVLSAKDGNDTYSVGAGIDFVTDNRNSALNQNLATTTVTGNGTIVRVQVDTAGDGLGAGDVTQYLAVGAGADLNVSWIGNQLQSGQAVLNGTKAVVVNNNNPIVLNGSGVNSDLVIFEGNNAAVNLSTGASDDAVIVNHLNVASVAQNYTVSLGAGNDGFVGGNGIDDVTGGLGSDLLVLSGTYAAGVLTQDAVVDIVKISDGDSTAAGFDRVVGFGTAANNDSLDLVLTAIGAQGNLASNTVVADSTVVGPNELVGNVAPEVTATIVNGVVTFTTDADGFRGVVGNITVGDGANQLSVAEVLAFLATNLNNTGTTVGFAVANTNGANQATYDVTGAASATLNSFFVFQDGQADTVVELVGNTGIVALAGAAAANTVVIV